MTPNILITTIYFTKLFKLKSFSTSQAPNRVINQEAKMIQFNPPNFENATVGMMNSIESR